MADFIIYMHVTGSILYEFPILGDDLLKQKAILGDDLLKQKEHFFSLVN